MAGDLNYFVLETRENLQRFTTNLESIISKYDREFSDDEEINISNLEDIKINGIGRLSRQRPRVFGNSRLLTTKRREQSILSECRSDITVNKTLNCYKHKDNQHKVLDTSDNSNTSDDFVVWRDKSIQNGGKKNSNAWGQTFNLSPKGGFGHVPSPTNKDDEVDGGFIVLKDKCENALSFLESDSEEPSDGETLSSLSSSSCSDREDIGTEEGYDIDTDEVYTVLSSCSDDEDDDIQIVNLPQKTEHYSSNNFKKNLKEKTKIKHDRDDMTLELHIEQTNKAFHTYNSSGQADSQHIAYTGDTKITQASWNLKNTDSYKSPGHLDKWHYTQGTKKVGTAENFNNVDTHEYSNQTEKWHLNHNPGNINTVETNGKSPSFSANSKMNFPDFRNRLKNGIRKRRYRPVLPEISREQIIAYLNGNDVNISALYSPEILKKHRSKLYNKHEDRSLQLCDSDPHKNIRQNNATEVDMKCIRDKTAHATMPKSERIGSSVTVGHNALKSNGPYQSGCTKYHVPDEGNCDAIVLQPWYNRNENNFCSDEMIAERVSYKEELHRQCTSTNRLRNLLIGNCEQMATLSENTRHSPFRKSARDLHDIDDLMKSGFNSPDFGKQKIPSYASKSVPAKCLFSSKTNSNVAKFMKMKESSQFSENKVYKWSTPHTAETSSDRFMLKARRRLSLISGSAVSNSKSKWIQDEENEYSEKANYDPYDFSKCGDSPSTHLSKLRLQTPPSKHPESSSHSSNYRFSSNLQTPPSKHPESSSHSSNYRFSSNLQTPPSKHPESSNCSNNNIFTSNLQTPPSKWQEPKNNFKNYEFTHKLQTQSSGHPNSASYNTDQAFTHILNTPPSQRPKPVNHSRDKALSKKQQNIGFFDGHSDKKDGSTSKMQYKRYVHNKQSASVEASDMKSSHFRKEQNRPVSQMYVTDLGGSHRDIKKLGPTDNKLFNYVCISSPPARKKIDSTSKFWTSSTNNSPVSAPNVQQHFANNSPISDSRKLSKPGKSWNSGVGEVNKGLFGSQIKFTGFRDKRLAIIHPQNGVFKKPDSVKSDISDNLKDVKNGSYKNGHYEKRHTTDGSSKSITSLKYFQSTPLKANKKLDLNDSLSTIFDNSHDSSEDDSLDEIMTISPSDIE